MRDLALGRWRPKRPAARPLPGRQVVLVVAHGRKLFVVERNGTGELFLTEGRGRRGVPLPQRGSTWVNVGPGEREWERRLRRPTRAWVLAGRLGEARSIAANVAASLRLDTDADVWLALVAGNSADVELEFLDASGAHVRVCRAHQLPFIEGQFQSEYMNLPR